MRKIISLIPTLIFAGAIAACDKPSSDGTKERARSEGEANSEIAQKTQADKAKKMEDELKTRHAFYQAMAGTYEGLIATAAGEYNMRAIFVPSRPPYVGDRVRELSEIESDLKELFFHVQILQWPKSGSSNTAYGCRFANILPDMGARTVAVASDQCSLVYRMSIGDRRLTGSAQASTIPAPYTFDLRKVEP